MSRHSDETGVLWSIAKVFTLAAAAEILETNPTMFKKHCRACGISRWPHRQFQIVFSLLRCSDLGDADREFVEDVSRTSLRHRFVLKPSDERRMKALAQKHVYKPTFERHKRTGG